jgi:hypothetical protein
MITSGDRVEFSVVGNPHFVFNGRHYLPTGFSKDSFTAIPCNDQGSVSLLNVSEVKEDTFLGMAFDTARNFTSRFLMDQTQGADCLI